MRLHGSCIVLAGIMLAFVGVNAGAQTAKEKPLPFSPGETLTYNVNWSIFPAGKVTATLSKDKNASNGDYLITTTAQSEGFVSLLYKVRDEFQSVFNPQTLCSVQISKHVNEGHHHKIIKIKFDSSGGVAILDERNLNSVNEPPRHAEHEIPSCVQDVVSAFYYVRSQPLHVGQKIKLAVNDGSKTATVVADVTNRGKIKTPVGTHEALRVVPSVFGNLYKRKKGKLVVWFSADKHHYPLRIKAILKLGAITGTLASVSPAPPGYSSDSSNARETGKKPAERTLK